MNMSRSRPIAYTVAVICQQFSFCPNIFLENSIMIHKERYCLAMEVESEQAKNEDGIIAPAIPYKRLLQ